MTITNADILKLLPEFMRGDGANKGLAAGSNQIIKEIAARIKLLSKWDQIDAMGHEQLNEMAWELNIQWYDSSASLSAKRKVVKESDMVYSTLGTKWAVESVLQAYFGDIYLEEWPEYAGQPFYFKIFATDPSIMSNKYEQFMAYMEFTKRKSAWLESIIIILSGQLPIYAGMVASGRDTEHYFIGMRE